MQHNSMLTYVRVSLRMLKFLRRFLTIASSKAFTTQLPHLNMACLRPRILDSLAAQSSFISLSAVSGNSSNKMEVAFQATQKKISKLFSLLSRASTNLTKILTVFIKRNLMRRLSVMPPFTPVLASHPWLPSSVVLLLKKS